MKPQIHTMVVAPVNTTRVAQYTKQDLYVGAASRKIWGIVVALQAAGCRVTTVFGVVPKTSLERVCLVARSSIGSPVISIGWKIGLINRLYQSIRYCAIFLRLRASISHVLLYNYYIEYIPVAILARIFGKKLVVDFEDLPLDEVSVRELVARASLKMMLHLSGPICLSASSEIERRLKSMAPSLSFVVVHGVMDAADSGANAGVFKDEEIHLLYCGSIEPETGSRILASAIPALSHLDLRRSITIHVAGIGDFSPFHDINMRAFSNGESKVELIVHGELDRPAYLNLLSRCNVGLVLKMPGSKYFGTTFPSKALEFSTRGMAVIAFDSPDMQTVLGEDGFVGLKSDRAVDLAKCIARLARNPTEIFKVGESGRRRSSEQYSTEKLGQRLIAALLERREC